MRFRILITMIASVCLTVSGLANAVSITHNNYTLNDSTNIVTHTDGTEWLQWDVTKGKSIKDALDIYASDGWVLAGHVQIGALFADFGWLGGTDENTSYDSFSLFTNGADDSPMDKFIRLFGFTSSRSGGRAGFGYDALSITHAAFGDDSDADGYYNEAFVRSDWVRDGRLQIDDASRLYGDSSLRTFVTPLPHYVGVALVRVTNVHEPSILAIFALGIIGLASRRFKKQS